MLKTQCSLLRPMIVGGLTATMLIFASTLHAQADASIDKNKVIGEDGVKQQGVIGEEGLKKAPPPYEIVKAPYGNYYRLTPEQLKAIAAK
jgi:hypothetical protein